jgi:hypothetical protein
MTVLSLQWLLAWPRRRAAATRPPAIMTRRLDPARFPASPGHRTYRDSFFADPTVVEDDSRRMRPGPRLLSEQGAGRFQPRHLERVRRRRTPCSCSLPRSLMNS